MTVQRLASNVGAAIVGAIVGATVVLAAEGATRSLTEPASQAPGAVDDGPILEIAPSAEPVDPRNTILLAWSPGGMPLGAEKALEKLPSVTDATTIRAGLDWIELSRASDGSIVDKPPEGLAIPFEMALIEPEEYAAYVAPSEREAVLALQPGQALLAQSASELRGAGSGLRIHLRGGRMDVSGVVSDVSTQGYEALGVGPTPPTWDHLDRFVLMRVTSRNARSAVAARLTNMLDPGRVLRIRAQGETPFLRYGDAVLPQLHVKSAFGEFAAAPNSDGTIETQGSWRRKNIAAEQVPILGSISCHRGLFPQLRHALQQVEAAGLSFTVDPSDFGGCYSPRFIDSNPGGRLSHHSWGIAIDFNVAQNRPGTRPDLDKRLVRIMEDNGFTWGGRWLIPDGMHFEWVRFP